MLSPRSMKSSPTVILYELRMIRPSTRSEKIARAFEGSVKKWRGVARWYLQAHTSARGEAVLQIVCERHAHVSRIDNLYASWRRNLGKELQLPKNGACIKRATWTAIGAESYIVDVRVMHDAFDAATAKLWAEIAAATDASRCSYMEPAMPPQQHRVVAPVIQQSTQQKPLPIPSSKEMQLLAPTGIKTVVLGSY